MSHGAWMRAAIHTGKTSKGQRREGQPRQGASSHASCCQGRAPHATRSLSGGHNPARGSPAVIRGVGCLAGGSETDHSPDLTVRPERRRRPLLGEVRMALTSSLDGPSLSLEHGPWKGSWHRAAECVRACVHAGMTE